MKRLIKITKIKAVENARHASASMADYEFGQDNMGLSLPIDYYVEGYLKREIKVGQSVIVERISRNGIKSLGIFSTSEVTEVFEGGFKTLNSVYKFDYIM
jgi:hypothetical protein